MKRLLILIFLIAFLVPATTFAAELKNERAQQEGNRLVIRYDLEGKEKDAEVGLTITVEGKTYQSSELHVEGDVGKLKTGKGKRVVWNILRDFPRGFRGAVDWELTTSGDAFKDPTTGMEMIFVKGGCYRMGDTVGGGEPDEKPVHEVCVNDFYIGKYEVTQRQWQRIMGNNPSRFSNCGDNCPVEQVSWNDTQDFIRKLNSQSGKQYRLPTEAEWEYAARSGGKGEKWAGTSSESSLGDYAWYSANSGGSSHPVGQKQPNGLGLHDMAGNVWEWCQDWYGGSYYSQSPRDNPGGPSSGSDRIYRGGCWRVTARNLRAACRRGDYPGARDSFLGFRLALPPGQ
jgi:formylglycine-generating enzyme required for sulfatase activity